MELIATGGPVVLTGEGLMLYDVPLLATLLPDQMYEFSYTLSAPTTTGPVSVEMYDVTHGLHVPYEHGPLTVLGGDMYALLGDETTADTIVHATVDLFPVSEPGALLLAILGGAAAVMVRRFCRRRRA